MRVKNTSCRDRSLTSMFSSSLFSVVTSFICSRVHGVPWAKSNRSGWEPPGGVRVESGLCPFTARSAVEEPCVMQSWLGCNLSPEILISMRSSLCFHSPSFPNTAKYHLPPPDWQNRSSYRQLETLHFPQSTHASDSVDAGNGPEEFRLSSWHIQTDKQPKWRRVAPAAVHSTQSGAAAGRCSYLNFHLNDTIQRQYTYSINDPKKLKKRRVKEPFYGILVNFQILVLFCFYDLSKLQKCTLKCFIF